MPLDELQRIEIAIELDKGVSHEELARKFSISVSELKNIAKLILETDVSSKQKVHRKRKSESDRGLIIQKLLRGELPEKISEDFDVSLKVQQNLHQLISKRQYRLLPDYLQQDNLILRDQQWQLLNYTAFFVLLFQFRAKQSALTID